MWLFSQVYCTTQNHVPSDEVDVQQAPLDLWLLNGRRYSPLAGAIATIFSVTLAARISLLFRCSAVLQARTRVTVSLIVVRY
jgi:hypothetical protein